MGFIILVRHAITQPQPGVSPHAWSLTDEGREKAQSLAERLHCFRASRILSSDEPKALETAQLLAGHLGSLAVTPHEALRETHRTSAPFYRDVESFKRAIRNAMQHPQKKAYGDETFQAAQDRFARAIGELVDSDDDETVIVVSHGTVLALYIASLTGLDAFSLWELLDMPSYAVVSLPDLEVREICFSLG
ncbi:MAG: histidine phosphatase family protein [Anaerolineae bacterium]|nr:histidine phosphatase family protein [Anaerolineae bacterium]